MKTNIENMTLIDNIINHGNGLIQMNDNLIELKIIGAIFAKYGDDYFIVELQLKNGKYKRLKTTSEVKEQLFEYMIIELNRRTAEAYRCSIPKPIDGE